MTITSVRRLRSRRVLKGKHFLENERSMEVLKKEIRTFKKVRI